MKDLIYHKSLVISRAKVHILLIKNAEILNIHKQRYSEKSTAVVVHIHTEPGKYSTERSNQFYWISSAMKHNHFIRADRKNFSQMNNNFLLDEIRDLPTANV